MSSCGVMANGLEILGFGVGAFFSGESSGKVRWQEGDRVCTC